MDNQAFEMTEDVRLAYLTLSRWSDQDRLFFVASGGGDVQADELPHAGGRRDVRPEDDEGGHPQPGELQQHVPAEDGQFQAHH